MAVKTLIQNGTIPTLCRQCDMHCGIACHIRDGRLVKITGIRGHVASGGRLCAKAPAAIDLLYHPDRLVTPLKRCRDGSFVPIPYPIAMAEIAESLLRIRKSEGARSVGVWTGEAIGFQQQENYARRFIHAFGSPNYFSAESVCWISRYLAYRLTQGYYNPCPDFARARLVVLWGANPGHSHPPYMWAIDRARKQGAALVVVDPRRTAASRRADLFLPIRPGTDAALAWGIARHLIHEKGYDRAFVENFTEGFGKIWDYCSAFTPDRVAAETGLDPASVVDLAGRYAAARPRVVDYPGISLEHQPNGVDTLRAVAVLGGLCGAVDRPGGDPWPEPLNLSELTLYESRPLEHLDPIGHSRFPALYRFRRQCHSLSAMDAMLGRGAYPLRGLVVTGANPVLTNPAAGKVERALDRLELFVVRDLFMTETARRAHWVLPAAGFLERTELHVYAHCQAVGLSRQAAVVDGAVAEYPFWRELAHRCGFGERDFPWPDETAVNRWLLAPTGITIESLEENPRGTVYAPVEFEKYRRRPLPTRSGKFEFVSAELAEMGYAALPAYRPPATAGSGDPDYPFVLITGARYRLYYHSRFRNLARLNRIRQPVVEMHEADALGLGVKDGERVRVETKTGGIEVAVMVRPAGDIRPGVIQIGHGWDRANANRLTDDRDLDPVSGYPNMKRVPARVMKLEVCRK